MFKLYTVQYNNSNIIIIVIVNNIETFNSTSFNNTVITQNIAVFVVICERIGEPGGAAGGFVSQCPSQRVLWSQRAVHGLSDKMHVSTYSGKQWIQGLVVGNNHTI